MQENNWKITTIETTKWANNFAELLKKEAGRTYFLQGKWGSGKTEYIKKVADLTEGNLKFVYLKLWKPKNNKSLTRQLFSAAFPCLSWILTALSWVVVIIMIGGSVWLALKDLFQTNIQRLLPVTILATVLTTLFNLATNKVINVDTFLSWLSLKRLQRKCCQPIVLVIDDFDRIDPKMQKELYKLFNAIQEKPERARIIFIGDYDNIQKNKDNYLSKIIDQIIALPIVLNAGGVASRLEETISNNLDENISGSEIKELFIDENRTLRDANQFLDYAKREFCDQKKKGRVQTDQQLYIIYLYLFHKKHYKQLIEDWLKNKNNAHKKDKIDQRTEIVLNSGIKYPKEYRRNQPAYFINELATNHSISELIDFVENKTTELEKITFSEKNDSDNYYSELRQFLKPYGYDGSTIDYFKETKSQLCKAAFFAMNAEPRHKPNELIKDILEKSVYTNMIENTDYSGSKKSQPKFRYENAYNSFDEIYKETSPETSLTRLIYIYRTCFPIMGIPNVHDYIHDAVGFEPINRYTLTKVYSEKAEEIVNEENFGQQTYDAEALLVLLCFNPYKTDDALKQYNIEYLDVKSKVDKIEQLCDTEYIAFWDAYFEEVPDNDVAEFLEFPYKGQNYSDWMHGRCFQIKRRIFYCFGSEDATKLGHFLKSEKWIYFVLRIIDTARLNEQKYTGSEGYEEYLYKCLRGEINKLIKDYNGNSEEKQLLEIKELLHAENESTELEVLMDLLNKVESDPKWTSKL